MTFYVLTLYLLDMKTTNPTIQSVWEENDSTEQSKKFENKQIFVQNNGINATNNLFVKKECKDIGSKKKCRCDINHIGERFGKLTIIKQYSVRNKRQSELKVDYKCDCGTTTFDKSYQKVKRQKMCLKCRGTNLHKVNKETSFSMLFNDYTRNATRRNLVFDLSRDEFLQLTKQKCFYCGSIPSAIKRKGCSSGEYIYNGVDRKDNSEGYTTSNCVPCCKLCNFAKHILDRDGFLNHIKRIYDYQFVENKR